MPETQPNQVAAVGLPEPRWKELYCVGGLAPFVTLVSYLSELIFIPWDSYPASMEGWFALFQRSKLLGLFTLNALDILSIALMGIMFLALYAALKQANPPWVTVAAYLGLLGVGVFVAPRAEMLSIMTLSDRYAAAVTEIERARLLAAGEALGALGTPTPQTVGFLFMAIAVLVISAVMLRERRFGKIVAWVGIGTGTATVVDHLCLIFAPALATPLMIVGGLFWLPWWVLIGLWLFQLARREGR